MKSFLFLWVFFAGFSIEVIGYGEKIYSGITYPTDHYLILAPANTFKAAGSWSTNGEIVVSYLAPDGEVLKAGDLICRFEFMGNRYLPYIEKNLKREEAELEHASQKYAEVRKKEMTQYEAKKVQLEQAELDRKMKAKQSLLQQDLARSVYQIEKEKLDLAKKKMLATISHFRSKLEHAKSRVNESKIDLTRYELYKARHELRAQGDEVVRYVFSKRFNRKVKIGDSFRGGSPVVAMAQSKALSVKFYVDEGDYQRIKLKKRVSVLRQGQATMYGEIASMNPFPEIVGYLYEDHKRSDSGDRVYKVHAHLGEVNNLQTGVDVEVAIQ